MKQYSSFLELLNSDEDLDIDVIVGSVEMPATFVWDEDTRITEYGISKYMLLMQSSYKVYNDSCLELDCEDYRLGEEFFLAAAGYISESEYNKLFYTEE